MTGIYKITNLVNGHFYIGMSVDIEKRFRDHKAPRSLNRNHVLSRAMRRHGRENFILEVLEQCEESSLSRREIFWIAELKPHYNMTAGGIGARGVRHSEETKRRLSALGKMQWGRKTEAQKMEFVRSNLIGWQKPRIFTADTRRSISEKLTGRKWTSRERTNHQAGRKPKSYSGHEKWVCQTDKEGWIYGFFRSVSEAASKLRIHPSTISAALTGRRPGAAGYQWKLASQI